ncbi:RagB/SusD family nutrient uptake outer membrane protein [Filimonas effusa]|uniref:RagB/SusD family nutrient uptake outer membrane protein n=1 Tax=Filimonas effusa TaxID=2508721 RepID=A0A4Q1DA00_9BACT|nr:RagB/SusD family nutrient uptake outer membrane protein [Filimonas effusa]RXK86197.1 RagB/SusD family nutrient uptake outer membrane protein [Filimonas effusa]
MKPLTIKIYFIAAALSVLASCSKLNEQPFSSIFTDQFYKTASDAEAALTAAYSPISGLYNTAAICASDWSADQIYPRPVVGRNTLTLFNYDANYTTQKSFSRQFESPQQIWESCYQGIEKVNWVLAKVPNTQMDVARRDQIMGEAYFLRAFYHWTLTKNFGDVILKTSASNSLTNAVVAKSTQADIYKQVFADLDVAVNSLPSYSSALQKGRTCKEVALLLYAKAALYSGNWPLAFEKAQAVRSSNKYTLMAEVTDLYNVAREDVARQENMWAFECESATPGLSNQMLSLYGPKNSDGPAYGASTFGSAFAYQAFFDSFDPSDARRKLLDTFYVNKSGQVVHQKDITPITPKGVLVKKYMDANSVGISGTINVPIFRFADAFLIAAEAEARQNGATKVAYDLIHEIRFRAHVDDLPQGLSKDQFIEAVLQERSWEFFAEGDRWYDLTRTGKFLTVIPAAVNDVYPVRAPQAKHKYFPIPQDEINANVSIQQNDPWK